MSTNPSIWRTDASLDELNALARGTMIEHVGIEFIEIGPDFLRARMPVDGRTLQPFGILHGGASVVLAETLGSMAANLCIERDEQSCVGLDISANHLRTASSGHVTGRARPVHLGGRTQVWEIRIENAEGALVSISRLTLLILNRQNP